MTIARGIAKRVTVAKEPGFGTLGTGNGTALRRVQSTLALEKDSYQSQEIITSQQIRDARHGVRRIRGNLTAELAPGSYRNVWEVLLRRDWTTGTTIAGTFTASGTQITRAAGNFLTDGIKAGDIIRGAGYTVGTAWNDLNLRVVSVLAGTLSLASGAAGTGTDGTSISVVGKKTFAPDTGHLYNSLTFEHWFGDLSISERFLGCKPNSMTVNLPATGMSTIGMDVVGKSFVGTNIMAYATPDPSPPTSPIAAVNGSLYFNGQDLALVTGASFTVNGNITGDPVVGSNEIPELFEGRIGVQGQLQAYFDGPTLRDLFVNEVDTQLLLMFTTDNSPNASFVKFWFPRVKLMSATKDDGEKGLVQTVNFMGLELTSGADDDLTTMVIQDSNA